ncbi:hypothetical protein BBBOND_0212270 [Babesia bigemina]|uniref:Uncharacterized protein n=1 Tax=Babesia bigemina TaxID=5866 RepID=A0A061DD98_BABBI|nr:hypothetical protein BBBOND_0212270 [Babesia bigemina]CDR96085.1 hypothetical protein BBBOND_0212270 [Babesia bigemina]|eukprot:XP_012768271.1 hypothetical protein BBBOND_0212270 [Babesia bigemina]
MVHTLNFDASYSEVATTLTFTAVPPRLTPKRFDAFSPLTMSFSIRIVLNAVSPIIVYTKGFKFVIVYVFKILGASNALGKSQQIIFY